MQAWLQERQYATPYHWEQTGNDEIEYHLRTEVVLELARVSSSNADRTKQRLLDIGCGDARFAADAARRAWTVGVDVSQRALTFAHDLVPAGAFDVVTLLDVIEHIPDANEAAVIREALRVLKPGGHLVISTNTDRITREWKHYRHYSIDRFRRLFDSCRDLRLVGLIPYFPTLRVWMQAPGISRLLRARIKQCPPEQAHVVIGGGTKA
ncbi:MAG TPA: methyltransferase domain-containing protein [Vicinamibacterales bacterium]